jgi:hypothetical protein
MNVELKNNVIFSVPICAICSDVSREENKIMESDVNPAQELSNV